MSNKFVFFYTVEINNFNNINNAPNAFFQTIYSVYSIRKLWGDIDKIRIYSNYPDKFRKILNDYHGFKNIEYIRPDEKEFTYSGEYGKKYGHARIFLLPQIAKEFSSDTIVYLDPDTGLRKSADYYSRNKMLQKYVIHLYRPETYNDFSFWFTSGKKLSDIWPEFKDYYDIPRSSFVYNNGIILVPPGDNNVQQLFMLKNIYIELYNKLKALLIKNSINLSEIFFSDMWACTIAYYKLGWSSLYKSGFHNIAKKDGFIPGDDPSVPFIHYYNLKNEDQISQWKQTVNYMKNKFYHVLF